MKKLITFALLFTMICTSLMPAFSMVSGPAVQPVYYKGNDNHDLDKLVPDGYVYYKIDSGAVRNYSIKFNANGQVDPNGIIVVNVTISNSGDEYTLVSNWNSNVALYSFVVKGGDGYNLYTYSNNYSSDTNLVSPTKKGKPSDVSHVSFIFNPALFVTPSPSPVPSPVTSPVTSPSPVPSPSPSPVPSPEPSPVPSPVPTYEIGDKVWIDTNSDGLLNNSEQGLDGVAVVLYDENNVLLNVTTTSNGGQYLFTGLQQGNYYVQFNLFNVEGTYNYTTQGNGANVDNDSNAIPATGKTELVNVSENNYTIDAGVVLVIPVPSPVPSAEPSPVPSPVPSPEPSPEPSPVPSPEPTPTQLPVCDGTVINFGNPSNPNFAATSYTIYAYAGTGIAGFNGEKGSATPSNHLATSGEVYGTRGLSVDESGNLYIADEKSGTVRKVTTSGVMSTITGNGIENGYTPANYTGKAYGQGMYEPMDVVVGPCGRYVFFLDTDHHIIRMIDDNGNLTTLAGVLEIGSAGGYSNGGGIALNARFNAPQGIAVDLSGNIYVADTNNHIIRKITRDGQITNIAGQPGIGSFSGDGGQATSATLRRPVGLAFDSNGDLYVADMDNHRIRKIDLSTGIITTVAGSDRLPTNSATEEGIGDNKPATEASLFFPNDIAIDAADNMYIADSSNHKIRKVFSDTNIIITIAGDGYMGNIGNGGDATSARLNWPKGIAVDGNGTVYISDTDNNIIRRLFP